MRQEHHHAHPPHGFVSRHRGGSRHGFGRFVASFNEDGLGGEGFRRGRKLGSSELQLLILALLKEQPSHGYELIKALDERSAGFYSPSPGMVYPALTYLEETGQATVTAEGSKKQYQITAEGSAYLEQNRAHADAILAQLARIGERMDHVRRAFAGSPEDDAAEERGGHALHHARHELKAALVDYRGAAPEEQHLIVEILRRATAEVRALGGKKRRGRGSERRDE